MLFLLLSCSPANAPDQDTASAIEDSSEAILISFEETIQPIFEQHSCAECHLTTVTDYEEMMSLRAGVMNEFYNSCINMMWIEPFEPENSFLLHKLQGSFLDIGAQGGSIMPENGAPLSENHLELVREWIAGGALP